MGFGNLKSILRNRVLGANCSKRAVIFLFVGQMDNGTLFDGEKQSKSNSPETVHLRADEERLYLAKAQ